MKYKENPASIEESPCTEECTKDIVKEKEDPRLIIVKGIYDKLDLITSFISTIKSDLDAIKTLHNADDKSCKTSN